MLAKRKQPRRVPWQGAAIWSLCQRALPHVAPFSASAGSRRRCRANWRGVACRCFTRRSMCCRSGCLAPRSSPSTISPSCATRSISAPRAAPISASSLPAAPGEPRASSPSPKPPSATSSNIFQVTPERVVVIPPVVDDDFRPCEDQQTLAAFRARYQLPDRYILFLGTLEPRKNITGLLEAYARLRTLDPAAPHLVLAGAKGWYYDAIFERIRALHLEPAITFAGYVSREEQPLWYAASELFVYPSVYEGFGMPVAEALACGTPTITSNRSSLPEAGGPVAVQVDPDDWQALAYAMQGSLADGAARLRALREGPRWAQRFSRLQAANACAQVYEAAAQSAGKHPGQRGR